MDEQGVYPFSCGTQYGDFVDSNCRSCRLAADPDDPPAECPCELEQALLEAYCGDGRVSLPIAGRLGATANKGRYVWPCPEHDPPFVNVPAEEGHP